MRIITALHGGTGEGAGGRAGNVCKGSLRPGRRVFLVLLLFLIMTAVKVLSLSFLGLCSYERSGEEAKGPGGTCCTALVERKGLFPEAKRGSDLPAAPL